MSFLPLSPLSLLSFSLPPSLSLPLVVMGQFHHDNVVVLYGVISRIDPVMIVMEYLQNGSLDRYLQVSNITVSILVLIAYITVLMVVPNCVHSSTAVINYVLYYQFYLFIFFNLDVLEKFG